MRHISIALPEGNLLGPSIDFLNRAGITCDSIMDGQKKVYLDRKFKYRLILLDPFDIPVYVERGGADLGLVTGDILLEKKKSVLQLLELDFGRGKLVLAGSRKNSSRPPADIYRNSVLATNYPDIARNYFLTRSIPVEIINLSSPVELALEMKIADLILTSLAEDFPDDEIIEIEKICDVSNIVIANKISFKLFFNRIHFLIQQMRELIENNTEQET